MGDQQNERRYTDVGGHARTLREMIVLEPEWAASRIEQCEALEAAMSRAAAASVARGVFGRLRPTLREMGCDRRPGSVMPTQRPTPLHGPHGTIAYKADGHRALISDNASVCAPTDWDNAQSIADLPDIDEALSNFAGDSTGDNGVEVVRAIMRALSHAGRAAVGIVEPADHQSVGALVGDKPRRMALAETSPGSIQSLPEGTRIFAHAAPQVAVPEGWKPMESAPTDRAILINDVDGHIYKARWDAEIGLWSAECGQPVVYELEPTEWCDIPAAAPTAPAGGGSADDAAREHFKPVDLPHREEASIYRAALEKIARYPRNANEELGYPACRSIASEAIGEGDLLLANAVTPSEVPE